MTFTIREIAIVTAYSALVLAKVQILDILLFGVSCGATLFLFFIFGSATMRQLFAHNRRDGSLVFCVPLSLLIVLVSVPMLAVSTGVGLGSMEAHVSESIAAMLLGVGAASVPLLLMLDSRYPKVTNRLLAVGYGSLLAGAVGALVLFNCAAQLQEPDPSESFSAAFRVAAISGLLSSVITSWFMSPAKDHEELGEL